MKKNKSFNIFTKEIELISSKDIRSFVIRIIEKLPEGFFIAPASSSGKYHLKDECKKRGLVLHTKRVVRMAHEIYGLPWYFKTLPYIYHDCLIAAALLHDICKSGRNWENKHTVPEHPILAAEFVLDNATTKEMFFAWIISQTIKTHMGTSWYNNSWERKGLPEPVHILQKLLHEADYLVSRKYIKINPL